MELVIIIYCLVLITAVRQLTRKPIQRAPQDDYWDGEDKCCEGIGWD
jgi:hypothetical protein